MRNKIVAILLVSVFVLGMASLSMTKSLATSKYDLDGNGKIDMEDMYMCALAFGSYTGHTRYDIKCDVAPDALDGNVNMLDIYAIAAHFGE